jgi:glutathione S-transferase
MERHLAERRFFVANTYSIADIALYAYTHAAGDGGFDLGAYPAIRDWIARIEAQPRFVPMPAAPPPP